jgi:hypothetical protein
MACAIWSAGLSDDACRDDLRAVGSFSGWSALVAFPLRVSIEMAGLKAVDAQACCQVGQIGVSGLQLLRGTVAERI